MVVFMKIADQFGNTAIDQLHSGKLPYIGFHHQGVHPPDPSVDPDQLRRQPAKVCHAVMIEVNAVQLFVIIAPLAEPGECLVADRLFIKACCMQGILEPWVKDKVFYDLIVRKVKELLQNQCPDNDIYGSIGAGSLIRVKNGKVNLFAVFKVLLTVGTT